MSLPHLRGLILAGGYSQRMGQDKSSLVYRALSPLEQYKFHAGNLESMGLRTSLSVRQDQKASCTIHKICDSDHFCGGPGSGLLSAHLFDSEAAWLVLACDFPFADVRSLKKLIAQRKGHGLSTAYKNREGFFEPFFAIWEPETLKSFLKEFELGNKSPRRTLEKGLCHGIAPYNYKVLVNINSIEQAHQFSELGL